MALFGQQYNGDSWRKAQQAAGSGWMVEIIPSKTVRRENKEVARYPNHGGKTV